MHLFYKNLKKFYKESNLIEMYMDLFVRLNCVECVKEVILWANILCILIQNNFFVPEIIAKLVKPPPLCRPSVSQKDAPREVIEIMKQSWCEMPDTRLDFDFIYQEFKKLNRGRLETPFVWIFGEQLPWLLDKQTLAQNTKSKLH